MGLCLPRHSGKWKWKSGVRVVYWLLVEHWGKEILSWVRCRWRPQIVRGEPISPHGLDGDCPDCHLHQSLTAASQDALTTMVQLMVGHLQRPGGPRARESGNMQRTPPLGSHPMYFRWSSFNTTIMTSFLRHYVPYRESDPTTITSSTTKPPDHYRTTTQDSLEISTYLTSWSSSGSPWLADMVWLGLTTNSSRFHLLPLFFSFLFFLASWGFYYCT